MKYATIDHTDVQVSRLSFGTASLHHLFSGEKRQRLLCAASNIGITHFDTSPYYGYGLAETDLGLFMRGRRSAFTITTKVGLYAPGQAARTGRDLWVRKILGKLYKPYSRPLIDWSISRARDSLGDSLRRLGSDYVDFLFLHEPYFALSKADEFLRWLEDERSKGRVRYWGLAGLPALLEPWLLSGHGLASVLQTKDSLEHCTANFIRENGREFQFTYGYLYSGSKTSSAIDILNKALLRNKRGSIIISTRRCERLMQLKEIFN